MVCHKNPIGFLGESSVTDAFVVEALPTLPGPFGRPAVLVPRVLQLAHGHAPLMPTRLNPPPCTGKSCSTR